MAGSPTQPYADIHRSYQLLLRGISRNARVILLELGGRNRLVDPAAGIKNWTEEKNIAIRQVSRLFHGKPNHNMPPEYMSLLEEHKLRCGKAFDKVKRPEGAPSLSFSFELLGLDDEGEAFVRFRLTENLWPPHAKDSIAKNDPKGYTMATPLTNIACLVGATQLQRSDKFKMDCQVWDLIVEYQHARYKFLGDFWRLDEKAQAHRKASTKYDDSSISWYRDEKPIALNAILNAIENIKYRADSLHSLMARDTQAELQNAMNANSLRK